MPRNNNTIKFKFHLKKSTEPYRPTFLQRYQCTYNTNQNQTIDLSHPAVFKTHKIINVKNYFVLKYICTFWLKI